MLLLLLFFGDGEAARKIVAILETETMSIDKKLAYQF